MFKELLCSYHICIPFFVSIPRFFSGVTTQIMSSDSLETAICEEHIKRKIFAEGFYCVLLRRFSN